MKVTLISATQAVDGGDFESTLVEIARVSSSRKNKKFEPSGLIGYLIKNRHWSPFEMMSMCVEITTSRAISLQIVRHRSFAYQQFSQRYAASTEMEFVDIRRQAADNRQSSTERFNPLIRGFPADKKIGKHLENSKRLYTDLIEAGVAKETARFVLPATTQTRLYMNGTMRSWIHYLEIRDDEHAQLEHRRIAIEIKKIFVNLMPHTSKALGWI